MDEFFFENSTKLSISSGMLVVSTIGAFVYWITLTLTGMIPCGVMILGLIFIPDSSRWLAMVMVGYQNEFVAELRKLRGENVDVSKEAEIQM